MMLLLVALLALLPQEAVRLHTAHGWAACQYAQDWVQQNELRDDYRAWNSFVVQATEAGRCRVTTRGEPVVVYAAEEPLDRLGAVVVLFPADPTLKQQKGPGPAWFLHRGALLDGR
jgi:hypothetical protein